MRTHPIALLGGGRWGRIIVQVLSQLLPADETIVWVSRYGFTQNQSWLEDNALTGRVHLHAQNEAIWSAAHTGGLIIANATLDHADAMVRALEAGLPVFCEKPFALEETVATRLAERAAQTGTVAGVNLEFATAPFVQSFAAAMAPLAPETIEVTWHDPLGEERHGERKRFDPRIPVTQDGLPHCLSLFCALGVRLADCRLEEVSSRQDHTVSVRFGSPSIRLCASLSRHAPERRRSISINHGQALLDFTEEPGHALIEGQAQDLNWGPPGPMSVSLGSFLDQIDKPSPSWPLAILRWTDAVKLAEKATEALRAASGV